MIRPFGDTALLVEVGGLADVLDLHARLAGALPPGVLDLVPAARTVLVHVDTAVLLDLARDAAHGVARPAAPLTTFLVGYAAARAGGGPREVADQARKAAALAARWAEESPEAPGPGKTTG